MKKKTTLHRDLSKSSSNPTHQDSRCLQGLVDHGAISQATSEPASPPGAAHGAMALMQFLASTSHTEPQQVFLQHLASSVFILSPHNLWVSLVPVAACRVPGRDAGSRCGLPCASSLGSLGDCRRRENHGRDPALTNSQHFCGALFW